MVHKKFSGLRTCFHESKNKKWFQMFKSVWIYKWVLVIHVLTAKTLSTCFFTWVYHRYMSTVKYRPSQALWHRHLNKRETSLLTPNSDYVSKMPILQPISFVRPKRWLPYAGFAYSQNSQVSTIALVLAACWIFCYITANIPFLLMYHIKKILIKYSYP